MKRITLQFLRKWKPSFLASVGVGCVVFTATVLPIGPYVAQGNWFVDFTLDSILFIVSSVMYFFLIFIMGKFATLATNLVVMAAFFENFTTLPAIKEAWTVVRDLSNMIFIVILLLIAFGTLFRIEAYSWKKLLPKMILAAILINYSRAIVGALVDASQIVMRTFAEAIAAAADVGISRAFNLGSLLSFGDTDQGLTNSGDSAAAKADSKQRLLGIMAAGMMLATLVVVQLVYATVLVGRLVMIWFLTVLYPLAIACMVLPATEKYFKQANELLARYITVGPMALFYLWLAMFIASKSTDLSTDITDQHALKPLKNVNSSAAVSKALEAPVVANFIIATMMLLAGMKMAQDNASEMGSITSKASSVGQWVAKAPARLGAKGVGVAAGYINDVSYSKTGMDLNLVRVAGRWKEGLDANTRKRELDGRTRAGTSYKNGNFMAGVLGAGDEVAEKGISPDQFRGGIIGQIPVLGAYMNKHGFGINPQARYNRARNAEKDAENDVHSSQTAVDAGEAALRKDHMTVPQHARAQEAANAGVDKAVDLVTKAGTAGSTYDIEKEGDTKEALQDRLADLKTKTDSASITEAAKIEVALTTKGNQGLSGINMTGAAADLKAKRDRRVAELANPDITSDGRGGTLNTKEDLDRFINGHATMAPLQARLSDAQNTKKDAAKRRQALAPRITFSTESKQRSMIAESKKNITTSDSAELQGMLVDALQAKKGADVLAIIEKLSETGNYNDAFGALRNNDEANPDGTKFTFSAEGVKDLAEYVQKQTGMSEQAVLSTIHHSGQQAKMAGHFPVSEVTAYLNGKLEIRDPEVARKIQITEQRKRRPAEMGETTRLNLFDGDQYHSTEDTYIREEAQQLLNRRDTRDRPRISDDKLTNGFFLDKTGRRWKKYIDSVREIHGEDGVRRVNDYLRDKGILDQAPDIS